MAKVILFDGGDGGGLIIGPDGVRPIPPFSPKVRNQLKATAKLVQAVSGTPPPARDRLRSVLAELAVESVGSVESEAGSIDAEFGLIFTDDDGGFSCGSSGALPIPLPWPPANVPAIDRLIQAGIVGDAAIQVLRAAADQHSDVIQLLRDPEGAGRQLGIEVSESAASQIRRLGLGDPSAIQDPVDREVVEFFHRSISDGNLIEQWASDPQSAADEIGFPLSNAAASRISSAYAANTLGRVDVGQVMSPYAVAVVVVVVIVVVTNEAQVAVIDQSGRAKF